MQVTKLETEITETHHKDYSTYLLLLLQPWRNPQPFNTHTHAHSDRSTCTNPTAGWTWRTAGIAPSPGAAAPKTPSSTQPPWKRTSAACPLRSPTAPVRRSRPLTTSSGCITAAAWATSSIMRPTSTPGKVGLPKTHSSVPYPRFLFSFFLCCQ